MKCLFSYVDQTDSKIKFPKKKKKTPELLSNYHSNQKAHNAVKEIWWCHGSNTSWVGLVDSHWFIILILLVVW
jgi:hypothetical protein